MTLLRQRLSFLLAWGCGVAWPLIPLGAQSTVSVTTDAVVLAWPAADSAVNFRQAGYRVAVARGYFAAEGLQVELRPIVGTAAVVDQVLAAPGVYGIGREEVLVRRMAGAPVVMLAAIEQETGQALWVRPPARAATELAGSTIGLRDPVGSAPLRSMLRRMGLGPDMADWRESAGPLNGPSAFAAWQVEVGEGAAATWRPADQGVVAYYGDVLFTREAELAHYPERAAGLRRAVLRGWAFALEEVDETINLLERVAAAQNQAIVIEEMQRQAATMRGLIKPSVVPLGALDAARLHEVAVDLVALGVAPKIAHLEESIYREHAGGLPRWVAWIGWAFGSATLIVLVVLVSNLRLQRRFRATTRALQESQERYREMFAHAPVAIVEEDFTAVAEWVETRRREGIEDLATWLKVNPEEVRGQMAQVRTLRANETALRTVGAADLGAYAENIASQENPTRVAAFREKLLAIWRGESQARASVSLTRRDGSTAHGLLQWTVPNLGGRPDFSRVLLVMTEVTELRNTELRLRESEERFRNLFEGAIEGVYESTPEEGLVGCNPAFARMMGLEHPEQVIAWTRETGLAEIYRQSSRRKEFLEAVGGSNQVLDFESEVNCPDGSRKWISENVRVVRNETGHVVRLQGFVSDISERKQFEQELAGERERLAVTLRAMTEGVITTDRLGRVNFVNEAAEHLTGWVEGAAIGRSLGEICMMRHERTRAPVPTPFDAAMRGLAVVDLPRGTALVDRLGVARVVDGRCAPINDPQSQPVGVVFVLRDVTDRVRHEAEMVRTTKLESLGVLAGGIAHDFNNLLTVVLGNLHLSKMDTGVKDSTIRWLRDAESAAEKARDLTHQLLTFAKGGNPVRTAVQLPEMVEEAANFALHGANVKSDIHCDPGLWSADVDKGQIGQVVQNLVLNAVQAMPDGGRVRLNLCNDRHPGDPVRGMKSGCYVRIEIRDNGPGIKADHLSRIFDPYFTTKSTGSGLGLATVYAIIKRHAGHIEVESEIDRGTNFTMWLPALPSSQSRSPISSPEMSRPSQMSGRILFMDDEENICRMVETLLGHLGLEVVTVREGTAAVAAYFEYQAAGRPFDALLVDLTVPGGMGGREVVRHISERDPAVKAIVSSGYSTDDIMTNFRQHGFCARVSKPYRAADLARTVREVLEVGAGVVPNGGA